MSGPASVLVVGSLPPPAGGRRSALLTKVLELRLEGCEVTVLSLDPLSVAHGYLPGPGVAAVLASALASRRHGEIVFQLEPGLPVRAGARRAERAASLLALLALMRRSSGVTLRLQHLDDLPGGCGGRVAEGVWRAAHRIEVGDALVLEALRPLLGEDGSKIVLAGQAAAPGERHTPEWLSSDGMSADDVLMVVRRRAADERARLAAAGRLPSSSPDRRTRVPQWEWLPAPGAGVPDLGPTGADAAGTSSGLRKVAMAVLAAAQRHASTRLLARGALLALRAIRRSAKALAS